jgi:hypothetical protein
LASGAGGGGGPLTPARTGTARLGGPLGSPSLAGGGAGAAPLGLAGTLASAVAPSLAAAISRLLSAPAELTALAAAARARRFRTWTDYARDLAAWVATLSRRDRA